MPKSLRSSTISTSKKIKTSKARTGPYNKMDKQIVKKLDFSDLEDEEEGGTRKRESKEQQQLNEVNRDNHKVQGNVQEEEVKQTSNYFELSSKNGGN